LCSAQNGAQLTIDLNKPANGTYRLPGAYYGGATDYTATSTREKLLNVEHFTLLVDLRSRKVADIVPLDGTVQDAGGNQSYPRNE
jgi:hypothetical protein